MSSLPRIFFIGVGNMGHPMAANLLKAGYPLTVLDVAPDKAQDLLAQGAQWASSLHQGVAASDVVMASLPGPAQVQAVMLGEAGVMAALRPGMTVIDTSTSAVDLVRQLADLARQRGGDFLEAPVTNAVDFAVLGRLSIFVGGDQAVYQQHRPIFDVLGEKIFHVGAHGNGATIKLLTNLLWFVSAAAIGEGLMMGAKAGISWVAQHDVPSIFAGHYDPSFSLALCCKDLGLINQVAQSQGYELTMGALAQKVFQQAMQTYGPDAGELHVVRLLEERAGLLLRPPLGQAWGSDTDKP
jgi:3-hydroxyisobutyrate dehydrogenase-like beta-hydroxyacid dehydrogenase